MEEKVTPLKIARVTSGIKQWRFANLVGISAVELSYYENGRRRCPANLRRQIAGILEKSVEEIFPNEEAEK